MSTAEYESSAGPASERLVTLDVLRGFALLGILIMNIQSFAMIGLAYVNPYAYGDMTGLNGWVWFLSHVFADQKFMSMFSLLFGAGIVLMTGRQEKATGRSAAVHYRRMGVLLLIGLLHAYLIWYGDILVAYALCGMVVYLFRRLRPGTLIVLGVLAIAVHSGINTAARLSLPYWPEDAVTEFNKAMQAHADTTREELEAYRGPYMGQLPSRAIAAVMFQTMMFLTWSFWRAGGLMLIGMALFKLDVLSGRRPPGLYWALVVIGLAVGLPVILLGQRAIAAHNWEPAYLMFTGLEFNYWGSLFVCLAYIGAILLACRRQDWGWLLRPFAAVGQMALTNYLMQSLICTLLFYGHGLGWFGSVERVGQVGIVAAIWLLQLAWSPLWLRHFRFGPAEWVWRALTYGTWPAMRKRADLES